MPVTTHSAPTIGERTASAISTALGVIAAILTVEALQTSGAERAGLGLGIATGIGCGMALLARILLTNRRASREGRQELREHIDARFDALAERFGGVEDDYRAVIKESQNVRRALATLSEQMCAAEAHVQGRVGSIIGLLRELEKRLGYKLGAIAETEEALVESVTELTSAQADQLAPRRQTQTN
jgi:hypothetical protein